MAPKQPTQTRVLVIDDDEMSRELLTVLLEAEGYAVTAAESGDDALVLLESSTRPDIVLTDMQMPGSSPEQLAGRLRRACGRRTLLLAMSGSRPPSATISHFDGFLLKPFTAADVTALLETHHQTKSVTAPKKPAGGAKPALPRRPAPITNSAAVLDSIAASAARPASNTGMDAEHVPSARSLAEPASSAPVLDEAIYRQLAAAMPARQLHEMYAMCVSDARARIAAMRSLAAAHDSAQFMREAHAIKGSCGMLGATELHRMAATLEKHGPVPASNSVNSLDELSSACDRLERMLGARA